MATGGSRITFAAGLAAIQTAEGVRPLMERVLARREILKA